MAGIREDWFPTSIWYFDAEPEDPTASQLLALLRTGREGWSAGAGVHADDLLPRSELAFFEERVQRNVLEVARFERWDLERGAPRLTRCAAIVCGPEPPTLPERDPDAVLSGIFHVTTGVKGGSLVLADPRDLPPTPAPPVTEYTPWTFRRVSYAPTPGRMLLFPAWLRPAVEPTLGDTEAVLIHFDVTVTLREAS